MSKEAMKLAKTWFERNTYGDEAVDVYQALCEALAEQPAPQPEQEPYGYVSDDENSSFQKEKPEIGRWIKVFTTPPQRKPLSRYAIDRILGRLQVEFPDWLDADVMTQFARAIEAAHGIKEQA